jgi:hypothetical protein
MSTDNPSDPQGNRGRRRPGPTIDLEATEVGGPSGQQGDEMNQKPFRRAFIAWLPPGVPWALIGAGAAGALVAFVLFLFAGLFASKESGTGPLEDRLARLERQVSDLAKRPPPATVDPKTVDDLAGRLAKLETAFANQRPPNLDQALLNRLASLEGQLKALDERVIVVTRRTDDIDTVARDARQRADANATAIAELARKVAALGPGGADRQEVAALAGRIATIEQSVKAIQAELAKRGTGDAPDRAARLAVASAALSAAVERGDLFAAELAAAKALAPEPKALAALDGFAAAGVPTAPSLARELLALMPQLTQASGGAARDSGIFDRLQAGAEKLVRVRPLDTVTGDDAAAVLARVEINATKGDIAGALAELAKLPDAARAPAQAWIAKAGARNAALATSRSFATAAFAALGKMP